MTAGHSHAPAGAPERRGGEQAKGRLALAAGLIGGFFVVELVAGLLTGSLALLGDAGHMFTDLLGLGMALAAIQAASLSGAGEQRSFGLYRLEILAALANAVLLFGVAVYILVEAVRRLDAPPEISGTPMLVVAALGLVVNLVAFWLLREDAAESIAVEGAYLEVFADTLGSVAAVIAGVVITTTGFSLIDPILGLAIAVFVLPRTWRLGRRALRILLQAAPPEMELEEIRSELLDVDGVASLHDLHVWTLTSGMEVASVHLRLTERGDGHEVLDRARTLLRDGHAVEHATVQVEPAAHAGCDGCEEVTW